MKMQNFFDAPFSRSGHVQKPTGPNQAARLGTCPGNQGAKSSPDRFFTTLHGWSLRWVEGASRPGTGAGGPVMSAPDHA
ncbi:hypothetical protein BGC30_02080 [Novacetimonas hansenii]|nr:hypothetical protein BGC30_02080 [Novacetimonas hansenii]